MGNSIPHNHEDHIVGKGENSLQHYNLVHKPIPMPQAMKIPAAKAAVDKEREKLEKISAWNLTKVRSKKQVIDEARTAGATVHFASLMDICHLKNAELEAKHQKYKGRVVLRGDIVKDNSGSCAVFTEQGSSASQMTAAKIMDIISRLPGCDGQAADAVSAYTQVKMEDAHKLLKIPKSECPDIWIRLPRHKWPKSWSSMEDPVVPLERNLYGHPLATLFLRRTSQESINLERKSFLDCSSDIADLEELETMDASEIYSKRLNAKEVIFPKEGEFTFPIADGRIKTPGGDQELRTSTLIRPRPIRGEGHVDFLGESEGYLPQPHDSFPDAGEAINDFWSMSGSFIYRHHVEPRVELYSPREESFPIPLKYIDVSRTTHTNLDVKQEKRINDYWNIDGSRDLSDPWTGFTQFTLLEEKAPDGYMWSGERLTRKQLTSRPDHLWPELWKSMGKHAKLKEKQKWSEEKIHLENAGKLRGIYFIDPEDTEFKETIKNARKKLETSVAPAMPCKIMKNCGSASNKIKTKLACILEADESTRLRMGNSIPHNHEDHIVGKGENSLQHYNLVHKPIPMPQAMKIPAAKAAVDKEREKLEKISAWNLTKVRSKKQVIDEARTKGAKVHLASLMDICHLKNAEFGSTKVELHG